MKETNKNSFTKKNNKLMFKVTSAVLATSLLASVGNMGYTQYAPTTNVAKAANENYQGTVTFVTNHKPDVTVNFTSGDQRLDHDSNVNFGDSGHGSSKAYFIGLSDVPNYNGKNGNFVYKHEPIKNLFPNGIQPGQKVYAAYLDVTAAMYLSNKIQGDVAINKAIAAQDYLYNDLKVKSEVENAKKEITFYSKNENINENLQLGGVSLGLNPFLMAIARYSPTHYFQPGTMEHYPTTKEEELNDPTNKNYTYMDLHVKLDPRVKLNSTLDFNFRSYAFKPHMVLNKNNEKLDANFTITNGNPESRITFSGDKVVDGEFIIRVRLRSEQDIPNATAKDISEDSKLISNKNDNFIIPKEEIDKIAAGEAKPIEIKGYVDGWAKLYETSLFGFKLGGPQAIPKKQAKDITLNFVYNKVKFNKNSASFEGAAEQDLGTVNVVNNNTIDGDSLNKGTKPTKETVGDSMPADLSDVVANGKTYKFKGWNTQANGQGQSFTGATTVTEDQTVYAVWAEQSEEQHIKISETGKVAAKDGHAIFSIGNVYKNGFKDLEYTVYSDQNFQTKSTKNADVTWKVEAVAGFEKHAEVNTAASTMFEKTATVYEGNKVNVNKIKALKSGVYKVTASINGGQSSDYVYVVVPGDVDRNGFVDFNDSNQVGNYSVTEDNSAFKIVDEFTLILAELDYNGFIDANDANIIGQMFLGVFETN
ncbi:hypothetical protein [Gemella morbillorum]|mgnify:FL=1|uniref:hypothetical protein n=1 Tax=Gemella morbillorum TaxID=29391 RepID=UPI0028D1818D|nr:hypothetical protein [Gemella morbillorum]